LFGFWTVLGLAFAGQLYLSRSMIGDPVPWGFAVNRALGDWYTFALLSVPAWWMARRFPFAPSRWLTSGAVHLAASAVFSLSWMVLRVTIEQWQTRGELYPVSFTAAFGRVLVATFFFNSLIYWGVVLVQHALAYYQKFHERELHTAELETHLAQARLQALQMQLNPHFLFNTLNAIAALMRKDVDAADRMIVRLSDLLRYTLESTAAQEVPLEEEIAFLERYLEIQQARFGERLTVRRELDPDTMAALVPNLLLQPLVENALQHGIGAQARPGQVVLRSRRSEQHLELEVQDNGRGLAPNVPLREGVGLANTRARLRELHGPDQQLELVPAPQGGLIVRVRLPWRIPAPVHPERPPAI
jgi:signal transduction histidine kinase